MRNPADRLTVLLREAPQEVVDQQRKIRASLAQRWNENRDYIKPVIETLPQLSRFNERLQRSVAGGQDSDVDLDRTAGAHLLVFSLLKHAQELRLQVQGKVADLVEEERPPVGQLKTPLARSYGAGDRAFFMAEQFRFEQRFRQRRAVDLDQRTARSWAGKVDGLGNQLFSRARFAADQ